jgi:hypothetical protein
MWMYPGQVVLATPSQLSWIMRRSTPESKGSLSMGPIIIPAQPDPFKARGHQPLGESAQAYFHLTVSISAFLTRMHSYVGSWACVQCPVGGHLA